MYHSFLLAANIRPIIEHIRKEEAMVHAKLYNDAIGFSPETSKKRSKETEKHHKELQNIVSNYHDVSIYQYSSIFKYVIDFNRIHIWFFMSWQGPKLVIK